MVVSGRRVMMEVVGLLLGILLVFLKAEDNLDY